jgi:8-amino-7-oxononanoate synthase
LKRRILALSGGGVDIFEKCYRFRDADLVKEAGLYLYFRTISSAQDPVVQMDGQDVVMLGSNNYLGLTNHPEVKRAAQDAIAKYGTGCAGSRFLNGTLDIHVKLEEKLAAFMKKPAALTFSTGFQVNLGVISCLVERGDLVYLDKLDHACIVDGAKLAFGDTQRFNHGDLVQLERLLEENNSKYGKLIVVDGVYSMEGDIADIPELTRIARKHGAALAVDDAHALGVLGPKGDGTGAHFGMQADVDIIAGTFSKSLASVGGFLAADESVIHYLKHNSRQFIFTASLPPANTAGVLAALQVMQEEPERRTALWTNAKRLQDGFRDLGFDIGPTQTPIVPVLVGELNTTFLFWRKLFDAGVFTNPVVAPAVPMSECRLRTSLMATHTNDQIDFALEAFARIGKELGVI